MNISIIGGGITGLTTALALNKSGIPSKVYEQADTLNEIGAGVWLQPNAVQILQWLGIEEFVIKEGCALNKMEITYPNLRPIKKIKKAVVEDKYGNQTIAIHRGKLQRILYERCAQLEIIELGMPYVNHQKNQDKIQLHFKYKSIQTEIVLGADGIKSQVRKAIGLPSEFRQTRQICCRGIANIALPDHLKREGKEVWGHKRRFGFSQLSTNSVYFFIVLNKEICPKELSTSSLSALFKDFDPIVANIINASGDMHITELMDLKRLETWHNSNTCLIGDAAHATTPNMGQGACQGIEDAFYISHYLKECKTPLHAFIAFEKQRRKKVDYVVNNSWNFGRMVHSKVGQLLLIGIMNMTPEKVISKQMDTLYTVEGL
jgi:2-polyprenyl-6-methoxyphenol hydroxylase-like FAD-dependent oxidoreductase